MLFFLIDAWTDIDLQYKLRKSYLFLNEHFSFYKPLSSISLKIFN